MSLKAIAAVLIGAGLILPTSAAPAVAATPSSLGPCVAGWQELVIPDANLRATPFEVVTRNGSLAWILGSTSDGVLSLRWNGERLMRNRAGPGGRRGFVGGIAGGARSVIGVGTLRPRPRRLDELAGRIIGNNWVNYKVPIEAGAQAALADIAKLPSGKMWAVGSSLKGGNSRAIALRRSGGAWRRTDPVGSGRESGLLGVTRSPTGVVWAVGWRDNRAGNPRP
ncbi:MAG: hypothetical protein U9O18_03610, partial [Chloroflexota bacterium]|nr:hypothetical protein [Chloroflexota bacterium]